MDKLENLIEKNSYKLLILDLDGTLVKLEVDWDGLRESLDEYLKNVGITAIDFKRVDIGLEKVKKKYGRKTFLELIKIVNKFETDGKKHKRNFKLIDYINNSDVKYVIYSMNTRKTIKHFVVKNLKRKPSFIICKENRIECKPSDKDLLGILSRMNLNRKEVLFVGNSIEDRTSGKMAKIKTQIIKF
jgi:phosphoglycolate phosphatase-like HAD superfamily hydrolase